MRKLRHLKFLWFIKSYRPREVCDLLYQLYKSKGLLSKIFFDQKS